MGAPIHTPGMEGATAFMLGHRLGAGAAAGQSATVREWSRRPRMRGCFAFWRLPGGIQIAYAGNHPGDIPRSLWREWYGADHDLAFWNAARRELRITNHPPPGTVH